MDNKLGFCDEVIRLLLDFDEYSLDDFTARDILEISRIFGTSDRIEDCSDKSSMCRKISEIFKSQNYFLIESVRYDSAEENIRVLLTKGKSVYVESDFESFKKVLIDILVTIR